MIDDRVPGTTTRTTRIALVSVAGLGLLGALAGCSSSTAEAETPAATSDSSTAAPEASSTPSADSGAGSTGTDSSSGTYADGEYSAEGSYRSPGGTESIGVTLTVQDDVVTAVTVTPEATSGNAKEYQTRFASGISGEVVGKELSSLSVDKVAGSSLTGQGFNDAVEAIRGDAAA